MEVGISKAAQQFELLNQVWNCIGETSASDYQLGPLKLRLVFANTTWAKKMTVSFEHLAIPPVEHPDFTVRLWDSSGSGLKLPNLDWNLICQNGYHGHCDSHYYFHYFDSIAALSALNISQNLAYYVVRNSNQLPWWVDASPLQVILHVWLREQGLQLTHTAAVGDARGALLLSGKGGSGKSTTTLSCLMAGLNYLGEDYCLLESGPLPKVYSVYQSAKLEKHSRQLFPHCEKFIRNKLAAQTQKALVYYNEIFPNQIKTSLPIRGVVSLTLGDQTQPILTIDQKEHALKSLMMSTLLQLPFCHAQTMMTLKDLIANTSTYHLNLGSDLQANSFLIKKLLSQEER